MDFLAIDTAIAAGDITEQAEHRLKKALPYLAYLFFRHMPSLCQRRLMVVALAVGIQFADKPSGDNKSLDDIDQGACHMPG